MRVLSERLRLGRGRGVPLAATLFVAGLLAVAGCGGGDSSSDGGAATTTAASAVDLEQLRSEIEQAMAIPQFEPPGPAFDATGAAGKSIFNIPYTSEVAFLETVTDALEDVAREANVKFTNFPTQGQPRDWVRGMDQAVSQQADLVHLLVADPRVLRPQIKRANEADVPVVSSQLFGTSQNDLVPDGVAANSGGPFIEAGRLMADWVILDSEARADVLVVKNDEVISTEPIVSAIREAFATRCGDTCTVSYVNVPAVDWAKKIQPEVQSALVRDPDINYIIPIYDSMTQFIVAGIIGAGKRDSVSVATFSGTPAALKMVQDEDLVKMVVGFSLAHVAWASMDQMLRVLTGTDPVPDPKLGLRVFTDENVAETGTPPNYQEGYGDAFVEGFRRLWGLDGAG